MIKVEVEDEEKEEVEAVDMDMDEVGGLMMMTTIKEEKIH